MIDIGMRKENHSKGGSDGSAGPQEPDSRHYPRFRTERIFENSNFGENIDAPVETAHREIRKIPCIGVFLNPIDQKWREK